MDVIGIIMSAGKSSVDVALYTLLPIMVVMLIIMKYLEVRGILDVIVRWLAPAFPVRLPDRSLHLPPAPQVGRDAGIYRPPPPPAMRDVFKPC